MDNFSGLEKKVEGLVKSFRALSAGAEQVVVLMEEHLAEIRSGRAAIESSMRELEEKHARFTKDSSEVMIKEAGEVISRLTGEINQFMANGLFEKVKKAEGDGRPIGGRGRQATDGGQATEAAKPTEDEND